MTALLLNVAVGGRSVDALAQGFRTPPASARPHTWWHWMDGNVTKAGITADLEAMRKVGIGGAQMFTVSQDNPAGPAPYGGAKWRELTAFAVKEAARLGLELCIHNTDGWSSSGGPWITPADAMQVVAWSTVKVQGPVAFSQTLPPIEAPRVYSKVPFSRDIAVYAYKTPAAGDAATPPDFLAKTGVVRGDAPIDRTPLTPNVAIPSSGIVRLTEKLDANGHLTWDVPEGNWTILRMGYVPTGVDNHPATPAGHGLEVDKLSKEALDHHWAALMAKVVADVGPKGTKTLNNVLIDSYEVGDQNWTPKFREEFTTRRGYDPLPYLPVIAGRIVDDKERSERFLWDVRRTIADLYADNYYGHMAEIAHKNGMMFSTEPYGDGGFDTLQSGSRADIPMGEFWIGGAAIETTKLAASVGHTNGRPVVGAESFTADSARGRWAEEPYGIKTIGDLAFANGINRYIFHRYAMQPWLDLKPGMTMGQYGLHFERTQTWWTEAATWLQYVSRCQYLLQAGQFQADLCYFYGEDAPADLPARENLRPEVPKGYDYDGCDAEVLMKMSVKDGRLVLPSGMKYRVLVLPESQSMTPRVAAKIKELVAAGATVVGPKPLRSPSLAGFPKCDDEVKAVGDALWGKRPTTGALNRGYGKGRVIANAPLEKVLGVAPDFAYHSASVRDRLVDLHRRVGDADVYFVANGRNRPLDAACTFRVAGKLPELWHPETGETEVAPVYSSTGAGMTVPLHFDSAESVFVVFRKPAPKAHLTTFVSAASAAEPPPLPITIESARYETADGRGKDVTAIVRGKVEAGDVEIAASNGLYGDPAYGVVKHLVLVYRLGDKRFERSVDENETLELLSTNNNDLDPRSVEIRSATPRTVEVIAWKPGPLVVRDSAGKRTTIDPTVPAPPVNLTGSWQVAFPPHLGAPASATFDRLISWPESPVTGVKYFSGTATYTKSFEVPSSYRAKDTAVRLDLGKVKNFATVILNGHRLAVLWKPPFTLDVTGLVHGGTNRLEVKVTNLWPNRIIGDEQLPPEIEWVDGHPKAWPDWLVQGKSRPKTGRITFETYHHYDKSSPLLESGLIGPVTLQAAKRTVVKF